jgi:predicted DNA-binding transcriptional regulator AlpA
MGHAGSDTFPRPFSFGSSAEAELQASEVQQWILTVRTCVPNRIV